MRGRRRPSEKALQVCRAIMSITDALTAGSSAGAVPHLPAPTGINDDQSTRYTASQCSMATTRKDISVDSLMIKLTMDRDDHFFSFSSAARAGRLLNHGMYWTPTNASL
jgi:hypothetical protein